MSSFRPERFISRFSTSASDVCALPRIARNGSPPPLSDQPIHTAFPVWEDFLQDRSSGGPFCVGMEELPPVPLCRSCPGGGAPLLPPVPLCRAVAPDRPPLRSASRKSGTAPLRWMRFPDRHISKRFGRPAEGCFLYGIVVLQSALMSWSTWLVLRTAAAEAANRVASSFVSSTCTIFSIPLRPMTAGTPMQMSDSPYSPSR